MIFEMLPLLFNPISCLVKGGKFPLPMTGEKNILERGETNTVIIFNLSQSYHQVHHCPLGAVLAELVA